MKKIIPILIVVVMLGAIVGYSLLGVDFSSDDGAEVLRVYNWEEYISESDTNKIEWNDFKSGNYELAPDDEYVDFIYLFESYCKQELNRNVKVEYSTFGTCENMYNELNLSKKVVGGETTYSYDLVCPSEYMLLKMLKEGMLEPISASDRSDVSSYDANSSAYIRNLFKGLTIECDDGETRSLYDYATCYCWGTMGYVYNPEKIDADKASHWDLLWQDGYEGTSTIKDSVRDSYILALGYVYREELTKLKESYEKGDITAQEYNAQLTEIYNRTDEDSVKKAGEALTGLKDRLFGYEVDSGKKDMAQGKISINFAWSGDAVYVMDFAEDEEMSGGKVLLKYAVPEEGSNIFFDGWAMPKGANVELAREFINFISRAESGKMNMGYIGYTSGLAGDVMFENAVDWYGTYLLVDCDESDSDAIELNGKYYLEVYMGDLEEDIIDEMKVVGKENTYRVNLPVYDDDEIVGIKEDEVFSTDLSYFFNTVGENDDGYREYVLYYQDKNRQCETQYPSYDVVTRCTVMKCFSDDELRSLNNMWETAKVGGASLETLLIVIGVVLLVVAAIILVSILYRKDVIKRVNVNKNLKLISSEEIKRF